MYQSKFIFQFACGLMSISSLFGYSQVGFAGEFLIQGASIESSSFSNPLETNQFSVPDTSITVEGDTLNVSDQLQLNLNKSIDEILSENENNNNVIIAFIRGENIDETGAKITNEFTKFGVSSELTEQFKTILADLLSDSQSVDINQLNTAIKLYNQMVNASDDAQLIGLSESPEFKKVSEILSKLRRTVKCADNNDNAECVNFQ